MHADDASEADSLQFEVQCINLGEQGLGLLSADVRRPAVPSWAAVNSMLLLQKDLTC